VNDFFFRRHCQLVILIQVSPFPRPTQCIRRGRQFRAEFSHEGWMSPQ
jgi:hypothetical protein